MPYASSSIESAKPIVKGWCPGALTPMLSGDGLLMRAKIVGSKLGLAQAREIAAIARDCGNGRIDLSQRAQLQIRGVSEETREAALARLDAVGLLAPDAESEAVLNILSTPAPGRADALAARLAEAISREATGLPLPAKFLFLIDDGGPLGLAGVAADIRLERQDENIAVVADGEGGLAAFCTEAEAVDAALALARAFSGLWEKSAFERRRMRTLVAEVGAARLFEAAGLAAGPYRSQCVEADAADALGLNAIAASSFACVGAPLGRVSAAQLEGLAASAEHVGCAELRLTPWRAIAARAPSEAAVEDLLAAAKQLGFIVAPDDARLAIVACPGAPECSQAQGATRVDIKRLARIARQVAPHGVGLHVSGCPKGCALPHPAPVTLVATPVGGFDLVLDGEASAPPTGFAKSLEEFEELLSARLREARP